MHFKYILCCIINKRFVFQKCGFFVLRECKIFASNKRSVNEIIIKYTYIIPRMEFETDKNIDFLRLVGKGQS